MNTKINNWFIHTEYKPEYGIYSEFNSFESYRQLIGQIDTLRFCFGHTYMESIDYLSNSGYSSGNSKGKFTNLDTIISLYLKNPFPRRRNGIMFDDLSDQIFYDMDLYNITPFYSGCGNGDGRGTINGSGYDIVRI